MDSIYARERIQALQNSEGEWLDPCHVATDRIKREAECWLCHETDTIGIALVELVLREPLPFGDFAGIVWVGMEGVWYMDGDGDIKDAPWRPTLIPWAEIRAVRCHQRKSRAVKAKIYPLRSRTPCNETKPSP